MNVSGERLSGVSEWNQGTMEIFQLRYFVTTARLLHFSRAAEALYVAQPSLSLQIGKLEADHVSGEHRVRDLQHQLLAWKFVGDTRRAAFEQAARSYVDFYLHHMQVEESLVLPAAERALAPADWQELDDVFSSARDPLAGGPRDPAYDQLFTKIVMTAPAPIGLGP